MRAPEFWARDGAAALALAPLSYLWRAAAWLRRAAVLPVRAAVPVLCVGNLVAGGAGKTPVALSVGRRLAAPGRRPHVLCRGYGGAERGPHRVDPAKDDARRTGDEALLLAGALPTWVARDRRAGARAAVAAGAGCLVMDDGFQYPGLVQDVSLLVVDGAQGFGNGRVIPAGPLREPVAAGLARAQAVVLMGEDAHGIARALGRHLPILGARLEPVSQDLAGRAVLGFAGIGRPEKFRRTLEQLGCRVVDFRAFADHHDYSPEEVMELCEAASAAGAAPVTTAKDWVRLPDPARKMVEVVRVAVRWDDEAALDRVLAPLFAP